MSLSILVPGCQIPTPLPGSFDIESARKTVAAPTLPTDVTHTCMLDRLGHIVVTSLQVTHPVTAEDLGAARGTDHVDEECHQAQPPDDQAGGKDAQDARGKEPVFIFIPTATVQVFLSCAS